MKKEVESLKNKADVKEYFYKNMNYFTDEGEREVLKKYTNKELLYIYDILYNSKGYGVKLLNLQAIKLYLDNLKRALSL